MPAPNSILRLLALGACADVVNAFGTIARTGEGITEPITTEGVAPTGCTCASSSWWYCSVTGPESLTTPLNTLQTYTSTTLAGFANTCWHVCYKNPAYMVSGDQAQYWSQCEGGFTNWQTQMCNPNNIFPPLNIPIIDTLKLEDTTANPFKDSDDAPNAEYVQDICLALDGQDLDNSDAFQRCEPILRPSDGGRSIYFPPYGTSCHQAARAIAGWNAAAPSDTYKETCSKLYKYTRQVGERMAYFCEFDETKGTAGKCSMQYPAVLANECQALLCGTAAEGFTDGTDPDHPDCSIQMP